MNSEIQEILSKITSMHAERAIYHRQDILEFAGNPLVEALPLPIHPTQYPAKLLVMPPRLPDERQQEPSARLGMLERLKHIHIPTNADASIAMNVSRCLRWGYFGRNPMPMEVIQKAIEDSGIPFTEDIERYLTGFKQASYGFPVIGISGTGKTCSVFNVLSLYPQVIQHESYNGQDFKSIQLVWLGVDCPGDGSLKGLCVAILNEIDRVLGTSFTQKYVKSRVSKDYLLVVVSQLARELHLGILVIDDIQNLVGVKKVVSSELLNFMVHLINIVGIPVVMVGTPKMLSVLQAEFQQAKRATGEGEVHMALLEKNSSKWNQFLLSIWGYQYTGKVVPLSTSLNEVFFQESIGNPFLCAILYKLVQDDAIVSERETFDVHDVARVSKAKLGITAKMRKDMLEGTDVELNQYMYLWTATRMKEETMQTPSLENDHTMETDQEAVLTMRLMSIHNFEIQKARKYARIAVTSFAGNANATIDELYGFVLTLLEQEDKSESKEMTGKQDYSSLKSSGYVGVPNEPDLSNNN